MNKQIVLLTIALLVSFVYAISAVKRLGLWGLLLFIFIWAAVFWWARAHK